MGASDLILARTVLERFEARLREPGILSNGFGDWRSRGPAFRHLLRAWGFCRWRLLSPALHGSPSWSGASHGTGVEDGLAPASSCILVPRGAKRAGYGHVLVPGWAGTPGSTTAWKVANCGVPRLTESRTIVMNPLTGETPLRFAGQLPVSMTGTINSRLLMLLVKRHCKRPSGLVEPPPETPFVREMASPTAIVGIVEAPPGATQGVPGWER